MPIQIIDNFVLNVQKPIDNRFVVGGTSSFYATRFNIDNPYNGLRIWDLNDNQPYVYNGTTWSSEASLTTIQGTGTASYLPKFNTSNSLSNSVIYEYSSNILIGTTVSYPFAPAGKLQVNGVIRSTSGGFYGVGTNLTALDASNITSGSLGLGRISFSGASTGYILTKDSTATAKWSAPSDITVGTASVAQNITVTNTSSNIPHYLLFSSVITGNINARVNSTATGGFVVDASTSQLLMPPYWQVPPEPSLPIFTAYGALNPPYSFNSDPDTGIFSPGANQVAFSAGGAERAKITTTYIIPYLPILAIAGSETAPSISFNSDTNTGIYRPAADTMMITTGGNDLIQFKRVSSSLHTTTFYSPNGSSFMTYSITNAGYMEFSNSTSTATYSFKAGGVELFKMASTGASLFSSLPDESFSKTPTADRYVSDFSSGVSGLNAADTALAAVDYDRIVFVAHGSSGVGGAVIYVETTTSTYVTLGRINDTNGSCMAIVPAGKRFKIWLDYYSGSPAYAINIYKLGIN